MTLTRRRFIEQSWKVLGGLLGVAAAWTSWDLLRPRASEGFGARIEAGAPEAIPEGGVSYVSDGRFYLTRVEGELRALYQRCTHLGCRVPYCESSGRFECPCHGSIFNRKGEYFAGPAPRGMDAFPLRVVDGMVIVDTGTLLTAPPRGVLTMREEKVGPSCLGGAEEVHG